MSKTTFPTKNDLPAGVRDEVVALLNQNLASSIHFGLMAKQAHWNVKGPTFLQLHELFDSAYAQANEWTDLMAERAVQLGGVAAGALEHVNAGTRLGAYPTAAKAGPEHVTALSDALAAFGANVRKAIDASAKLGDAGTSDLFTEVSRSADKLLWFLEAHLHAER
ncbi:MAG: DNA starvation/stationary phase protection protein Dps [Sandaracinaceae bacterium]